METCAQYRKNIKKNGYISILDVIGLWKNGKNNNI